MFVPLALSACGQPARKIESRLVVYTRGQGDYSHRSSLHTSYIVAREIRIAESVKKKVSGLRASAERGVGEGSVDKVVS